MSRGTTFKRVGVVASLLALLAFAATSIEQVNAYDPPGNNPAGAWCDPVTYPHGCTAPTGLHRDPAGPSVTLDWTVDDVTFDTPGWFTVYKLNPGTNQWDEQGRVPPTETPMSLYSYTDDTWHGQDSPSYYVCSEYYVPISSEKTGVYELCAPQLSLGSGKPPSPPNPPPNNNGGNQGGNGGSLDCRADPDPCPAAPLPVGDPSIVSWMDGQGFTVRVVWNNPRFDPLLRQHVLVRRYLGLDGKMPTEPQQEFAIADPTAQSFDDASVEATVDSGASLTTRSYQYEICNQFVVDEDSYEHCIRTATITMPHEPPKAPVIDLVQPCADSGPFACPTQPKGTVWIDWGGPTPDGGHFTVQSLTPSGWKDRVQLDPVTTEWFDAQPPWDAEGRISYRVCAVGDWTAGGDQNVRCSDGAGASKGRDAVVQVAPPTNVQANKSDGMVAVTWDWTGSGNIPFDVERQEGNGDFHVIGSVPAEAFHAYLDKQPPAGVIAYRVCAVGALVRNCSRPVTIVPAFRLGH